MKGKTDINENEIRVIGKETHDGDKRMSTHTIVTIVLLALTAVVLLAILLMRNRAPMETASDLTDTEEGLFEGTAYDIDDEWYENIDSTQGSFVDIIDTVVDGLSLTIYTPYNTLPELFVGEVDETDPSILLCTQAADLRRDNGKILGAYVYRGEPLAWELSKRGYCAIIDGKTTVGVSDNSPLFEDAIEHKGYFFRQYALVDNGSAVRNNPENKSLRRALCAWRDRICIVVSHDRILMNDFSYALETLRVRDAIYLVGSSYAHGWVEDRDGKRSFFSEHSQHRPKNTNYILFKKK
jgi:hypothetical protein